MAGEYDFQAEPLKIQVIYGGVQISVIEISNEELRATEFRSEVWRLKVEKVKGDLDAKSEEVFDKDKKEKIKKDLNKLKDQWDWDPLQPAAREKLPSGLELKYIRPQSERGPGFYGVTDFEIAKDWPDWPKNLKEVKAKGFPEAKVNQVPIIEKSLIPIPSSIGTPSRGAAEDELFWGRPELIAGLYRWQRVLFNRTKTMSAIPLTSAYRRLGTTARGEFEDIDGKIDAGDPYGHWTGYCVDVGLPTLKRWFGLSEAGVERTAEAAGLCRPWYKLPGRNEPHHFRPDF